IYSGLRAAAAGGFTGVACMPNTFPPIDNPSVVQFIWERSSGFPVEVHPIAAITKGREGKVLTEMGELVRIGVTAFSDDGSPVASAELMRRALEYSRSLKALIIEHCDIPELSEGGVASEGEVSTRLGLPPIPPIAEVIAIFRNIALTRYTDGALHIAHLSTKEGLKLIEQAKREGISVSCEVTPHHLTLTCDLLESYDTNLKVNPPLREGEDCDALIEGLKRGTVDVIATDHAPHSQEEKEVEFTAAPFGMVGLETAVGLILTQFIHTEKISWTKVVEALSFMPRRLLRLPPARIAIGSPANLTFIDPNLVWKVDPREFHSQSRNSPYIGWELKGKAVGVANRGIIWIFNR
ncbi:MAG: dihydroorotase, partial [bacterium]